jgi:hypothetical protein
MAPPIVIAKSPLQFVFNRSGGAVVHARLSIWSGVGQPEEKRVLVLFFEDSLDDHETFSRSLPLGLYSCVLHVFVREDLHGLYWYEHSVQDVRVATDSGNVNMEPNAGGGLANKHEFVLSVE